MTCKLNKASYENLINEDIKAVLASNIPSLEKHHTIDVLRHSIECYYPADSWRRIEDEIKSDAKRYRFIRDKLSPGRWFDLYEDNLAASLINEAIDKEMERMGYE